MVTKTQVLKPDTVLKNYWQGKEQFADLFNAVLFGGKEKILPEELEDMDTEESSVFEHRDFAESIKAARDNIKIQKKSTTSGVQFVLLGLEHQEHIHYAMPLRVMGYDYGVYKKEYEQNAKKYTTRGNLTDDEFLSRMKTTDRFTPVITLVIYYGEQPWNAAKSLHELLNIPPEWKPFVNDYQMRLVEMRKTDLTLHNAENQDFFQLMQIVLDRSIPRKEAKEKAIAYSVAHNTTKSVVMTVAGAANLKLDYNAFAKGVGNMCTLFDEIAKDSETIGVARGKAEGRLEGKAEGKAEQIVEMGYEFGLSENNILERLQQKLNISLQTAQEYLHMFGKQPV